MQTHLETNLAHVRERIEAATHSARRPPRAVELVAVTKSVSAARTKELARAGQLDLGESRAADLSAKVEEFQRDGLVARWHFIGHLQRNKAGPVVEAADVLHSIDSLRLLETVARIAEDVGRSPMLFLQVKLHPEETKSGLTPEALPEVLAAARELRSVRLEGLMTIAPLVLGDDARQAELARSVFASLRDLRDRSALPGETLRLSMGMSADFELAIAAGSDCVRVGGALFDGLEPRESGA